MFNRHFRALGVVGMLTAATVLPACDSADTSSAGPLSTFAGASTEDHPEWSEYTFTLGDNGGDGSEELAKVTGVFDNAPYKVKFARFDFGPPLVQAAATGEIDLGYVGTVPPISGAATQYGFKIVATQHGADPTRAAENIIVPKDSAIQTLSDLKGKKLAIPQGSSAHGLALLAVKSVGLTPQDVEFVFLDPAAGAAAFKNGKVDAWSIWNPQSAIAVRDGARIIAKGLPPIDQVNNYYVATDKSLNDPKRRAALADVLTRISKLFDWAQKNPEEYAKAIAKETGVPIEDARATVEAYPFAVGPVTSEDVAAEQALADAFFEAGELPKSVDVAGITDNLLPDDFDITKQG
ncbi:aliphatic sulfonate ABC transporter substrate-binding protein [Mycolicibacterium confluentis]|uniref:Putative aliphatic sulfonates-binding protein n=1 Tax=Mycolicibacterium confluentis TaxID=28047 RepID=A0A7I7Y587_9MYCO|nr:aliphatic sulfonate ABC transporter substrate-binding protein [Mycolicibacterium confluentis]MCV7318372.1 aliphatic sulfonate ABC transporter substrate-binding protein [Mycolicibacterium confluentis]ORV29671.1 aliphatic sulfonate ABC transporter substrate-binding protein [Mycolicibacterium confluentis]BBZ36283.1 ABC transporter substrate-binding protein [Mycolicibacterium confluentis]